MLRVGIVGAGLIGGKRALAIPGAKLVAVADVNRERANALASKFGAESVEGWQELVTRKDVDAVIVATSNDVIPACVVAALENGKHVLAEKPAGRFPAEVREQIAAAKKAGKVLGVGFNHRFHPGFQKAKELIDSGAIGPLMYIRARYGHGGRLGYEKEWRANPQISGGGELLDQGVHLIDLCRFVGGEFDLEWGRAEKFFWDMPVEDNGFMSLKSPEGDSPKRKAFLHASCSEWKNLFDFEIFGQTGKLQIWGLGRSYGIEELRFFKMKPEMGPPDVQTWTYPGEDNSWNDEFTAFLGEIDGKSTHLGKGSDAWKAIQIVHQVYEMSGLPFAKPTH